ncbi:MAG: hypothetical protein AB7F40_06990 [Victivallaceae bacterium]
MSFLFPNEFAGIMFGKNEYTGVVLKKHGRGFEVVRASKVKSSEKNACARIIEELSMPADTPVAVAAALPGMALFSAPALELPLGRQRESLEFELPRRLPSVPTARYSGYTLRVLDDDSLAAAMLVVPATSLTDFSAMLAAAGLKPDALLHPAQALDGEAAKLPLFLPELDGGYFWRDGRFESGGNDDTNLQMLAHIGRRIDLSAVGDKNAMLGAIILAEFAASPEFRTRAKPLLTLLPETVRARRYRLWIKTAAILAALLLANYTFNALRSEIKFRMVYNDAADQFSALKNKLNNQQKQINTLEKQAKDYNKALDPQLKMDNPAIDWSNLAARLPENTRVNAIRWNQGKISVSLQTSDEADIPSLLAAGRLYTVSVTGQNLRNDQRMYELVLTPGGRK